ncbi:hypothetical protein CK203_048058 [Vitis vinifera]|uniref:Uncharacterized protein n=1 Tax=Vitis vinifera TaxID=29760 RepID=A0A438GZ01_VITVI|nr:hypothetical protein CK203_048058 [Vitis vinifera]
MTLALDCAAEPPEKRINMKDVVTLRLLTALTDLTGVTAAACCCTSEVVVLLKLGFFLGFGRTALSLPLPLPLLALHDALFSKEHRDNPLFTAPGFTRGITTQGLPSNYFVLSSFCLHFSSCIMTCKCLLNCFEYVQLETVAAALLIIHAFYDV